MATTEELLEQLEAEAQSETSVCIIDPDARTITVPPEYQLLGVENDKRVERLYFQCPKIVGDNQDLSQDYILFINYVNANGDPDAYKIEDMQVDGDNITFSWLLEEKVTLYQGDIQISFCGIIPGDEQEDPDKNRWGTTINTDCTVLTGLKCTQQVAESNPDALAQIWSAIDELKAGGGGSGTPGKDGVGIDRIEKTSTQGLVDTYTIYLTDDRTYTFTVTNGKDGNPGEKGDPGQDGITPTIGENGNWYLGDEDTGKPSRGEKGDPGQKGDPGEKGDPGQTGATPDIQIGTVQTLEPGQQATASMTGTPENPVLNLGIPKGEKGDPGEDAESGESYTLPIMSDTQLGGGKAVAKTDEDVPVAVDPMTGQLFVPTYPENSGTVDPEQIKQAVNGYLEENPVSGMTAEQERQLNQNTSDVADLKSALEQIEDGGWSSTQIDLFEAFTNVIAYTSPDANSIVSSLISSLRSGSSDTPEGSFSIIYVLSNVTSSSKDNSIKSGEPYNTTLTANPGYELESVIVKMGGYDVTSTAYSDGEIIISAVTGNIIITASAVQSSASGQLPQDGLVDYFDFRNKTYTAGSGGLYYMNSDFGNGMLYSWTNQSGKQGDNIGLKGAAGNYTTERATGYPVTDNFPSTRTVCMFGKGGPSVPNSIGMDSTLPNSFLYIISYRATDKTTKSLSKERIQYPEGFNKDGYNASFIVVNQNILKIYFDDTLHKTVDGSEIEDFESWDITPLALTSFSNYGTAYAIYNKELSKVEIVEALEFFKTLEVSE